MDVPFIYLYSIEITFAFFLVILLFALEAGFWLGKWWKRRTPKVDRTISTDISITAMYGLLGLVLAFTYSFTMGRADKRKAALLVEVNALDTAFLRAGLAKEPANIELQSLLRDYAETRLIPEGFSLEKTSLNKFLATTLVAQAELWPATERMVKISNRDDIDAIIVQSINDLLDAHALRLTVGFDRT